MKEHEARSAEEVLAEFAWVRRLSRRLCLDAASADDLTQEVLRPGSGQPPASVHELGRTGADGALVIDLVQPRVRSELDVVSPGQETLVHGALPRGTKGEYDVVVIASPVRVINGVVTDEEGTPVENAAVHLFCFEDFGERVGVSVPTLDDPLGRVITDSEGRFRFPSAPEAPQMFVRADAFGHEYDIVSAADRGSDSLTIPLIRTRQGETALRGHVVCTDGSSTVGALVALQATTDSMRVTSELGVFELTLNPGDRDKMVVHATLPGFLPAVYERQPGEPWPDDLVLEVGEPTLAVRGTVVDQDGGPLAGIQVAVENGTPFGFVADSGGMELRMQILEDLAATSGTATCIAAEDGAFEVGGLLARPYTFLVQEPGTLRGMSSDPIEAGQSGVRLVLDRSEPSGPAAGRVTDGEGNPVPGLQVVLWSPAQLGGENAADKRISRPTARTDADGRFRFEECVYGDARLRCFGGVHFGVVDLSLAELGDPLGLDVVLARNSPFRIEWTGGVAPGQAESMRLEAHGNEVVMLLRESTDGLDGGSVGLMRELSIGSPKTAVHYVREGTYDVVLLSEDAEVERFPVEIRGVDLSVIVH